MLAKVTNVADASLRKAYPIKGISQDDGFTYAAPVGPFHANPFGLYDMLGNVCEWCADWYAHDYYAESLPSDPVGPSSGKQRVIRGGSWWNGPQGSRSASRNGDTPAARLHDTGFRLARTLD